ncbi:SagB family peptide dehydrogenase [Krasilnikovia sp. M28-CT-15]|uniref:SagB family peptide dehydrogenase n=1 Tax=Krasilnikovia sp. M28-CT-15 TaxID=3373540 RepID=UPI0038775B9C
MVEYEEFHAVSSLQGWQVDRLRLADPATWPAEWTAIAVREPGRLPLTPLPPPRPLSISLTEALTRRRTDRRPRREPVAVQELADLLGWSLGLREQPGAPPGSRRHYPSAGARFPLDCHVLPLNVADVARSAAVYSPFDNALLTFGDPVRERDVELLLGFGVDEPPRVVLLLSASMKRTTCKYGNRGYRYALIEAGHVMQNLYLASTALDLPFAAVGGFSDIDARRLVDGLETDEIPLYCAVVP